MIRSIHWAIALSLLSILSAFADDDVWNRFRGPNGSGVSQARTVPARWTEQDYSWKIPLPGPGHSSPVVWEDRIFVTCGDPQTAQLTLVCVDARSGRILWQHAEPSSPHSQHPDNSYATSTPTVDAVGVVITWSTPEAVMLLALDLEGRELWRRDLGPMVSLQGSGSSPILYQDLVVLVNDQEDMQRSPGRRPNGPNPKGRSFVIAIDRKTGETRWQTDTETYLAAYSTPCVYSTSDGRFQLICSNTAHGILAIDPATGRILWEFGQPFLDRAVVSPLAVPGLVLAGHGAGLSGDRYLAVRPGADRATVAPALAYELTTAIPMVPTPLIHDGRLYLWCDDGVVSCVRVSSGEQVWRERVEGSFFASPVWVDGRLYNVSKTGDVVVLAASDTFELVHRISLGEPSYASPAVAGGVMYLRTSSHLLSLGGRPSPTSTSAFQTRGVVLTPQDLTLGDWPERAAAAGLTTLALHLAPSTVEKCVDSPTGQAFLEKCTRLGLKVEYELHAVGELLPRDLFVQLPECFRMNESGQRTNDANLCVHSPRALEIAAASALRIAGKLRPTTGRYYFWGDDGAGWCCCPKCREYSDSDQALILENHLLGALRTVDPGATLAHLAYAKTVAAPTKIKPAPGVFLEFAPISRDYDKPFAQQQNLTFNDTLQSLQDNLRVFPVDSAQILEYWLDVSRFSRWQRPAVKLPWRPDVMRADAQTYADLGIRHVTTFAVYVDADYVASHGEPAAIREYGQILQGTSATAP